MSEERNRVVVRRAKWSTTRRPGGRHNWIVEDHSGGKVFTRQFVFSYFGAAIFEADRLARTGLINPRGLFGVQRVDLPRPLPPAVTEEVLTGSPDFLQQMQNRALNAYLGRQRAELAAATDEQTAQLVYPRWPKS